MPENPKVNVNLTVPEELLRKFINLSGHEKTMRCKWCNGYTTHISVSYSEDVYGDDFFASLNKVIMAIHNFNPLVTLTMGNCFACERCRHVRYEGGFFSDLM